jgi:hypothetical protein
LFPAPLALPGRNNSEFKQFFRENEDTSLPALFAYLVAICLLIGTGYAGVVWLTTPPELNQASRSGSAHPHKTKTFSNENTRSASNENTRSAQDSANSGEDSRRNPAKADSFSDSEGSNGHVERKSTDANRSTEEDSGQQKTVSQGSCVPIGMTAKGDLVFPLHCRELVDLLPETDPSVDESHKTQGRDPTEQPSSIPSNIPGRSADATMMEHPSSNDPVPPGRKELASPKAEPTIGDGASRNGNSMRSVRQSGRKLGSSPKQEQSSPTSSSKTAASQSDEWFNPLGLH